MCKSAILHIGTEKTGTTTIQSFLTLNRRVLLANGYDFPLLHNDSTQFWLPLLCYDPSRVDERVFSYGLANNNDRQVFVEHTRNALAAAVLNSDCNTIIFSSEFLSSRLTRKSDLLRLRELLEPLFDEIIILVYLREPLAAALSAFSTSIKSGNTSLVFKTAEYGRFRFPIFHCNAVIEK
jgi:hypothetical protein